MSKIVIERGSWGDYEAYIDGERFSTGKDINLNKTELLLAVLAKLDIEVVEKWHYYVTREVDGKERGVRVDQEQSNIKSKVV